MTTKRKRYIQCGAEYRITPSRDPYENYVATGLNTGNLYIGYAVNKIFQTKQGFNIWKPLSGKEVEEIRDSADIIVMGASNFINQSTDLGVLARNLKQLKLPIIVLGIGAQAPNSSVKKINLTKGTEDFLYTISEYSEMIGIRGEYTAEVLTNMGIRNITIIGCPTYYSNKDINYKINKPILNKKELQPVLNYTDIKQKCDEKIFRYAFQNRVDTIGQTEYIEEYWKREMSSENVSIVSKAKEKEKQYQKILNTDFRSIQSYFKEHFNQFYDIDQWADKIKGYNFFFGTRFHGNMIAIQNGIPALLVTHDSRTKELAEYCNIPYIEARNLIGEIDIYSLYNKVDYSKFNAEYPNKFEKFLDFLRKNNVTDIDELFKDIKKQKNDYRNNSLNDEQQLSVVINQISEIFYANQLLYNCPLENIAKHKNGPCISKFTLQEDGLHIEVIDRDPHFVLPNFINFDKKVIFLKLNVTAPLNSVLEVFYEDESVTSGYPYSEQRKISTELNQGSNDIYLALESESIVKSIRLDIGNEVGEYILHELEIRG